MLVKRLRNALVLLLTTGLFIAVATIALILARGNQITPTGIVRTGTIRVEVNPIVQFETYLNQELVVLSSNNTIDSVEPGEYELTISQEDYTPWTQTVSVEAGLVTDVLVQLFPEELNLKQLSQMNIAQIAFGESRRYAYYIVNDNPLGKNIGIWREPLFTNTLPLITESATKISNLDSPVNKYVGTSDLVLLPSPSDEKLILRTPSGTYLLQTGIQNEIGEENLLEFDFPVDEIDWLRDSNTLLLRSGNLLAEFDIESHKSTVIAYGTKEPIFTRAGNGAVTYQSNKMNYYSSEITKEIELENITLPEGIDSIMNGGTNSENFILRSNYNLYFVNITESYLEKLGEYSIISISPDSQSIIVSDGENILTISITISQARNSVKVEETASTLPNEIDTESIVWSPDSAYFIFQEKENPNTIFSADSSGNNVNEVFSSDELTTKHFTIPADNTGIILDVCDGTDKKQANLYRLDFTL